MVDLPEASHHHPSHTGHRRLDIVLGLSAMFVSLISLVVAVEHGRTMERMADANARMVDATSWPFIEFGDHNADEQGNSAFRLELTNDGIGPARIETFELWWDGKPISWGGALVQACCTTTPTETDEVKASIMSGAIAAPRILRAGEHVDFFTVAGGPANTDLLSKLDGERSKITTRICYCSVFDQCWIQVSGRGVLRDDPKKVIHPDRVAICPAPAVPYQQNKPTAR
jgi:hypothetical protein